MIYEVRLRCIPIISQSVYYCYRIFSSSTTQLWRRVAPAAIFVTDRRTLFRLVEEPHYQLRDVSKANQVDGKTADASESQQKASEQQEEEKRQDRTVSLIENFLENIPKEEQPSEEAQRKPTPADATVDYVAYLLETENSKKKLRHRNSEDKAWLTNLSTKKRGRIVLQDATEYEPEMDEEEEMEVEDTGYFTETLARIYIKQGRYSKALEIIKRLNLVYPKKIVTLQTKSVFWEIDNK